MKSIRFTPMFNWDAVSFFESLVERNKLAQSLGMRFCVVSSLRGMEDAVNSMQDATAFCCVQDSSPGVANLEPSPSVDRIKTVYLVARFSLMDMDARTQALNALQDVFRQFMSVLIRERTRLEQQAIYIDSSIDFTELSEFFLSGCVCAYFNIKVNTAVDMRYIESEWL